MSAECRRFRPCWEEGTAQRGHVINAAAGIIPALEISESAVVFHETDPSRQHISSWKNRVIRPSCRVPRRELKYPHQVTDWLQEWGRQLKEPASMILIRSAGILWHIARIGRDDPLPENSMDVDSVTESDAVAELSYDALIGSEFERVHGWHVNLMPRMVLDHFPSGWQERHFTAVYGKLTVIVPSAPDLLAPKLRRNEPRDQQHAALARHLGLL